MFEIITLDNYDSNNYDIKYKEDSTIDTSTLNNILNQIDILKTFMLKYDKYYKLYTLSVI